MPARPNAFDQRDAFICLDDPGEPEPRRLKQAAKLCFGSFSASPITNTSISSSLAMENSFPGGIRDSATKSFVPRPIALWQFCNIA